MACKLTGTIVRYSYQVQLPGTIVRYSYQVQLSGTIHCKAIVYHSFTPLSPWRGVGGEALSLPRRGVRGWGSYCLSLISLPSPFGEGLGGEALSLPLERGKGVRLLGWGSFSLNSTLFPQVIIFIIYNLKTLNAYLPLHSYTPAGENAFTIHRARAVIL